MGNHNRFVEDLLNDEAQTRGSRIFSKESCEFHPGARCNTLKLYKIIEPHTTLRRLSCLIGTPLCTPYAAFGGRRRKGNPGVESQLIYEKEFTSAEYDIGHMEESADWKEESLVAKLEANYIVLCIRLQPVLLGWPNTGKRIFLTAVAKDMFFWFGPYKQSDILRDYLSVFQKECVVDGNVFCNIDTERNCREARSYFTKQKDCHSDKPLAEYLQGKTKSHVEGFFRTGLFQNGSQWLLHW